MITLFEVIVLTKSPNMKSNPLTQSRKNKGVWSKLKIGFKREKNCGEQT